MNEAQVRAIELLAQEYDYGRGTLHAHKVAGLAASLFDQLQSLGLLPELSLSDRRTLVAAAYAHDLGASPRSFRETSGMTEWVPRIVGPEDLGTITFLVLRSRLHDPLSPLHLDPLTPGDRSLLLYCTFWLATSTGYALDIEPLVDQRKTRLLAGILRVADGLDCRLRLRVREIKVHRASAWLRLLVRTFAQADEEIARARDRATLLGDALGSRVFVQQVVEE